MKARGNLSNFHPHKWSSLSNTLKGRITLLITSLDEFHAALLIGKSIAEESRAASPDYRFISNGIFTYLHGYYVAHGSHSVRDIMKDIGLPRRALRITVALNARIGNTTARQLINGWRNATIAHPRFMIDVVNRALAPASLDNPLHQQLFDDALQTLITTTT